jgi:hypothetical protein
MNNATCPICHKQVPLFSCNHPHTIGRYIIYYDDDREYDTLHTCVYADDKLFDRILDLKGFVYLDEARIYARLLYSQSLCS